MNVITGTLPACLHPRMTPALAGAAPAGAAHSHAPEKAHLDIPQALTTASRKTSPKAPENAD
ncbi:hypothetical protein [Burkholderia anthina]|uniref:hypothetical protein n=1 Tax=Burkholderia anthina TaxID=179879 RepID=UPI000B065186|nr:hypothetical protein [Burkholderia anthina]